MQSRSLALLFAVGIVALTLLALLSSRGKKADNSREAFEAFVNAHPFANRAPMTREELKAIPKADRPDLAIEQQFLLTMDPETQTVPSERLWEANRRATALKREATRGGGPLATSEWEERGPSNVGGRTRALMFDPNDAEAKKMWAGGVGGGVWYTDDITDPDASWTPVNDFWSNLAVTALAYDPTDTEVFYAGTGEGFFNFDAIRGAGIFKSEDAGETWELLGSTSNPDFYYIQDILVHPVTGDVYATTRATGLQRSTDGGTTWETVLGSADGAGNAANDLELGADNTLYVTFGLFNTLGDIYASASGDSGSWTEISDNPGFQANVRRIELATAPSDADVLYAVTQASNLGAEGIYRSGDGGANWTEVALPVDADPGIGSDFTRGQAWYDLSIAVDPNDANTAFVGGIDIFKTTDAGASWSQTSHWYGGFGFPNVHADQHDIAFRPGSSGEAVFSHDGGITYTATATDDQPTWINRNLGYNVTQYYAGALGPEEDSDLMLAGAQDNGTQRYSEPGFGATSRPVGGDGAFTFIDQDEPNIAIASTQFGSYRRSTNGGVSFSDLIGAGGSFIAPSDYDDREDILYAQRNNNNVWRVSNVADSPQIANIPVQLFANPTHFRVSPYAPEGTSTVFVGTVSGRIIKIENAHSDEPESTLLGAIPGGGAISCIEIGASENQLLVTFTNYGRVSVWETFDGGTTWKSREGDLPDMPVRWALYHPTEPGVAIIATEAGVWETTNLGDQQPRWTPAPTFPTVRTDMLQWRPSDNRVMAATHGRGVFTSTWNLNAVATEGNATPSASALSAAYPNPFVDRTTFTLNMNQAERVRVMVYDVRGREVAVLHDGVLSASAHAFELDGAGLAAGIYLVVAAGENFRDEGRVTLAR